jgi:hypothetical protein
MRLFLLLLAASSLAQPSARGATRLFNGKDLAGWDTVGAGIWKVMSDGTLLGQFDPKYEQKEKTWNAQQSWAVTKDEFDNFRLSLEFWVPQGTNSGVAIRDASHARGDKPPSMTAYEIQVIHWPGYEWTTGSIFRFQHNKKEAFKPYDWNRMQIEARGSLIRVSVNGETVCELDDTTHLKKGAIGLQLHDKTALVMYKNIELELLK